MVKQKVSKTTMTHKDGKPRKKLKRLKASANGRAVDLKRLAARKTLVVRR